MWATAGTRRPTPRATGRASPTSMGPAMRAWCSTPLATGSAIRALPGMLWTALQRASALMTWTRSRSPWVSPTRANAPARMWCSSTPRFPTCRARLRSPPSSSWPMRARTSSRRASARSSRSPLCSQTLPRMTTQTPMPTDLPATSSTPATTPLRCGAMPIRQMLRRARGSRAGCATTASSPRTRLRASRCATALRGPTHPMGRASMAWTQARRLPISREETLRAPSRATTTRTVQFPTRWPISTFSRRTISRRGLPRVRTACTWADWGRSVPRTRASSRRLAARLGRAMTTRLGTRC